MYEFLKQRLKYVWYSIENMLVCHTRRRSCVLDVQPDWKYRGEGNCNVVLSLPKSRKILRIRKVNKPKTVFGWLLKYLYDVFLWWFDTCYKDELRDLQFYSKVMRPLLGNNYVSEAKVVDLSRKQINLLEKQITTYRPLNRRNKSLHSGRTTIFNDFAFLTNNNHHIQLSEDIFAIEIKPKQGWRPFKERYFPKCVFCLNQTVKLDKGDVKSRSEYCPEKLFSGNKTKMIEAIKGLTQTPQNNFRILKNGLTCFDDQNSSDLLTILRDLFKTEQEGVLQEFYETIQKSLIMQIPNSEQETCRQKLYCHWNSLVQDATLKYNLPKNCVLERILAVQMLDAEGTHYYHKLLGGEPLDEFGYVDKLLQELNNHTDTCLKCSIMILSSGGGGDLIFVPYLISSVAKDLSLMITLSKINEINGPLSHNMIETKFGIYYVNIGIFDLYPKPMGTIRKQFLRNSKIFYKLKEKYIK